MKCVSTKSWSLALVLSSALLASLAAKAEEPTTPAEPAQKPARPPASSADRYEAMRAQRDSWIKELGVSDEQRDQLRAAMKEQANQGRAIRSDKTIDAAAKREKIKEMREGMTAKVKKILTAEQFSKYENLQAQRREQLNTRIERQRPRESHREPTTNQPAAEKTVKSEKPAAGSTDKADK